MTSIKSIERFNSKISIAKQSDVKLIVIKKLTHLYMNGKQLEKIENLSKCRNVRVLYLHDNDIQKVEGLGRLRELTHLYLQWNKLTKIENLECLVKLKKLYLGSNEISRLENVEKLIAIEEIHIERQRIGEKPFQFCESSLRALAPRIKILNIAQLNLTSLNEVSGLHQLEQLLASNNKFKSAHDIAAAISRLPFLTTLECFDCPAQHKSHYREIIMSEAPRLILLDNKSVVEDVRSFVEKIHKQRNSDALLKKKSVKEAANSDSVVLVGSADLDQIKYKSWQKLNHENRRTKQVKSRDQVEKGPTDSVVLYGRVIASNTS